jgi:catechol 2,3-dioxygenase-like lactoylglutathione lyase family enzyme
MKCSGSVGVGRPSCTQEAPEPDCHQADRPAACPLDGDHSSRRGRVYCDANVDVLFVGPIAVIAPDPAESRTLYIDALGLPLAAGEGSDYWHTEQLPGTKHFAIWPLREVAQACFGQPTWPDDRPVPQASIEFEVADPPAVGAAAEELRERGFALLHDAREEPWGQTVARLLSPEGLIVGLSYAPALRDQNENTGAA